MDKEKVIGLSDRINEVVTSERPTSISWHKISYASELLQKELNSKPVMPVVFDIWYKDQYDRNFAIPNKIIENYAKIFWGDIDGNDDLSKNVMFWSVEGDPEVDWLRKLVDGIEAVQYGYEVEHG